MNNKILNIILIIGIIILSISYFDARKEARKSYELIEAIGDTLKVEKGKNNEVIARISVLETQAAKDFLNLNLKDDQLKELQAEVNKYKKELKEKGSVTIIETIIKIDTVWEHKPINGDTIIFSQEVLLDSIKNEWIDVTFGFVKGMTSFHLNKMVNKYTIAIGEENLGLFKRSKPFVEVTAYNPYTEIQTLRTYQVQPLKSPKWGLGVQVGYGLNINQPIKLQPYIGVGLNYNIITW